MNPKFEKLGFYPADVLLPKKGTDMTRWAVVACDQFTSQPEYWQAVEDTVADAPSSLRLILPEAGLNAPDVEERISAVNAAMGHYLDSGLFETLENALLYIERVQSDGKIRHGLIGMVDLEQYDFTPGSGALIRATEGTVLSRIPPRMKVRRGAEVELPHIMVLIDDPEKTVIEPLCTQPPRSNKSPIYMASLMEDGGRIWGYRLSPEQNQAVEDALTALADPKRFEAFYHAPGKPVLTFAMGDGNHSLATAKACWEERKATLSPKEQADHPARYALVELVNLHDESLEFEAIHRVLFDVEPKALLEALLAAYPGAHYGEGEGHQLHYVLAEEEGIVTVPDPKAQLEVGTLQTFLDQYLEDHGGRIDYIHGEDVTRELARQPGAIGFLLPAMGKDQLFPTVIFDGALPRKTFSMGEAQDKRFYLEARKIVK